MRCKTPGKEVLSEALARSIADKHRKRDRRCTAYRCIPCNGWHVGSQHHYEKPMRLIGFDEKNPMHYDLQESLDEQAAYIQMTYDQEYHVNSDPHHRPIRDRKNGQPSQPRPGAHAADTGGEKAAPIPF